MRASYAQRTVEPATRPVTVAEMRSHCRIGQGVGDFDAELAGAIDAAVGSIEDQTRRAIITQTWRAYISESWSENDPIALPRPRLQAVTSVEYRKEDDTWGTADAGSYRVRDWGDPATLWLKDGMAPSDVVGLDVASDSVWRVTYTAGYGDILDVPAALRAAIKLLAGHLFENREAVVIGSVGAFELPLGVQHLINPFRVPWGVNL
jgi:uncharacterized phiE125 gp8 family phage protein